MMADFAYWAVITAIGGAFGWFVGEFQGMIFLTIVCLACGAFQLLEKQSHHEKN